MKTYTFAQIEQHLNILKNNRNQIVCETYYQHNTKPGWSFIGWYSPLFNGEHQTYIIKKCKDNGADPLDLWLIQSDNQLDGSKNKYRITAKDIDSYTKLCSK